MIQFVANFLQKHWPLLPINRVLATAVLSTTLLFIVSPAIVIAQVKEEDRRAIYGNWPQWVTGYETCATIGSTAANLGVDIGFSLGTDPVERRTNLVRALMQDYGLTAEQASGPVGNFMWESGGEHLPPDINQGPKPPGPPLFSGGYGWAQWTGSRQRTFIDFAVDNGYMESRNSNATDAANYAYLKKELNEGYQETITELKKLNSPRDAAVSFEATFEKAGEPELAERIAGAEKVFSELSGGGSSTGGANNGGGCTEGGATIEGFPLRTTQSVIKEGVNGTSWCFENQSNCHHHYNAADIFVPEGTPVVAAAAGEVITAKDNNESPSSVGTRVTILGTDQHVYYYTHMGGGTLKVKAGDSITAGQEIGRVGTDANAVGTTRHLHFDKLPPPTTQRPSCSSGACSRYDFVNVQPELIEAFKQLPE